MHAKRIHTYHHHEIVTGEQDDKIEDVYVLFYFIIATDSSTRVF